MEFNRAEFGQRLYALRKQKKLSQDGLAAVLGVTHTQISDLEKGKTGTTLDKLFAICKYFNVSADYLLGLTENTALYGREE